MAITLNKVGVEIDGKVYQFYKLNFGFQRKLVELQSNLNKMQNEIAKKYNIEVSDIEGNEEISEDEKLELAKAGLQLQSVIAELFVNPDEAKILDNFDEDSLKQLIEALK